MPHGLLFLLLLYGLAYLVNVLQEAAGGERQGPSLFLTQLPLGCHLHIGANTRLLLRPLTRSRLTLPLLLILAYLGSCRLLALLLLPLRERQCWKEQAQRRHQGN
jgi:hypothetical protein